MSLRIGIVGCAGTGKSAFARSLSTEQKIPVLESKQITQDILNRDGYNYSSGIQVERFLANSGRQNEILRRTMEQEDSVDDFVTDRTVVDLAAYVVCEMHDIDTEVVRNIFETCSRRVSRYTHLFFCPWKDEPISENSKRTLNPWYQFLIHAAEMGILKSWGCEFTLLEPYETDSRMDVIRDILRAGA